MAAICGHGEVMVECMACERESIEAEEQPGAQWDWDQGDPSQYCRHGNFIGSWWGPDILCGRCEMGYD